MFYPLTYLKRQIDVLRHKMGVDVNPYKKDSGKLCFPLHGLIENFNGFCFQTHQATLELLQSLLLL